MEIAKDFREFLECLNARNVEYLVVGGFAVAYHGAPRFTGDIDVFARPTRDNGRRMIAAMRDFGYVPPGISERDFETTNTIIQMGVPPFRIDVITGIEGVSWEEAFSSRVAATDGSLPLHYIGLDELVKNKRAVGRPKDLMDLDNLGKLRRRRAVTKRGRKT